MTTRARLLLVLSAAAALRFHGLDWDQGHAFHPDERRIAFALGELSFRPLQLNPHFFAYGSFPLYVQKLWTSLAALVNPAWGDFSGGMLACRALSALIGVGTVALLFVLGRRLYGEATGVLAALLLALCVFPIQNAHFTTVDLYQSALVLVVLERLAAHCQQGRASPLFCAAAATGLALATKMSSAPLLLPLLVGPFLARRPDWRVRRRFAFAFAALALSASCFALGEPYALLDSKAFLHDVREQAAMVRQAGTLPYTIQYLGTRPYLDDLRQAFTWGTGPALGIAAGVGTLAALSRAAAGRQPAEILLLAFAVPYFAITGSFPVKFMRYLLPLYPLWCLYAARLLTAGREGASSPGRKVAAAVVVGATALHALAFSAIYLRPHVWVDASRWVYGNLPAGSTLLTTHWEEGFPVPVEGMRPDRYQVVELPLYDADHDGKIRLLADRLEKADALVFPSKRLYGAISNASSLFPRTGRLLELLFAGDLGYRLDQVFASRPTLLGVELDDDFADESFSVYDHPKTLLFRKTEALSAEAILERLRSRIPSTPVDRDRMLGAGTPDASESMPAPFVQSSLAGTALWALALAILAFSGARLLRAAVPEISDAGARGLGPVFGYLLFAYLSWLPPALAGPIGGGALSAVVAAVLALAALRLPAVGRGPGSYVLWLSFLAFLAGRAFNPEIYWGEKPMDFSFLNTLYRSSAIPPPEPWMSGTIINYPYFGHFGVAALGKLCHVSPGLAFNLGIATIGGLTAAAAFGLGAALTGRSAGGWLATALVAFAGNLSGPFEYHTRWAINFDYFWATSRVIRDTINEFPLWSFLFADLHAHVMALPLSLLLLGLAYVWARGRVRRPLLVLAAISLTLGAIATTNTWSFPVYAAALIGIATIAAVVEPRPSRLLLAPLAAGASYLWFLPYWMRFSPPPRQWGLEAEAAPLSGFVLIFGGFLLVLLGALSDFARRRAVPLWLRLLFVAAVATAAFASTRATVCVLAAASIVAAFVEEKPSARFAFALAAGAASLGALADTIYLWDRMNTIFKTYLEMWIFLSVASAFWLGDRPIRRSPVVVVALTVVAAAGTFTAVTDVWAVARTRRVPGPRPTLDGTAYLSHHRPYEAAAYEWLNARIRGTPILLEAHGPSYQEFTRVAMNTGLPTVLGWDYHLSQRAHPWPEIRRRADDVEAIYRSVDRAEVERLLRRYHVAIVYVGLLERRQHSDTGLSKFDGWTDLFQPIYRNPEVRIYAFSPIFRWAASSPWVEESKPEAVAAISGDDRPAPLPAGKLREPRGIAVDRAGNVWVANFGNNRIDVFDANLGFLRAFGKRGEGPGEFRDPCGIAIAPNGEVFVADTWNQRVQVFDGEGKFLRQWSGDFYGPRGIAVGPYGSVYVADTGNGRIAKFSPDGAALARWGKKGSGDGEFYEPVGIAVGADGRVYVADGGNRRIVVLSPAGQPLAAWSVPGWKPAVYREPFLAILPDDTVVAADPSGDRLLFFDRQGRVSTERKLSPGGNPSGVAVASDRTVVVGEIKLDRLQRVAPQSGFTDRVP